MRNRLRMLRGALVALPILGLVACGGGSGSSDDVAPSEEEISSAAPIDAGAAAEVPVVGEIVADCTTATGLIDTLIDDLGTVDPETLPVDLPVLSALLDGSGASGLPVLGGLLAGEGSLVPISVFDVLLATGGSPDLEGLPVLGQLATVCIEIVDLLPEGTLGNPAALLAVLGDPTHALGVVPVLDDEGNPVGVILATLPAALAGGDLGGLPVGTDAPVLDGLLPFDPTDVPALGGFVENVLALLNDNGVGGLGGLLGLLDFLGLLLI